MKVSIPWLKEFVDFKWIETELEEKLTSLGFTVENRQNGILDLEITANRGDCLSILGIAREVAALSNQKLRENKSSILIDKNVLQNKAIKIDISNSLICPRFTCRVIDNIKIAPSPKWLQKRLESYGFRPINNVVDITNYAMIELGQPLHAFDYDKIKNGFIKIRQAKTSEEIITLDGKKRILNKGAIIIEDDDKIYDLAGIMGGANSEVDKNTKSIILQSSIFNSILIRQTSKKLKIVTDASYRFERGVDFLGTVKAIDRATELIKQSCKTSKIGEIIDIQKQKFIPKKIKYSKEQISHLLGVKIAENQIIRYLTQLGFEVRKRFVEVPSWRNQDIKIWQDLAEEVARLYGYEKIKGAVLAKARRTRENENWMTEQKIKDCLVGLGFTEVESHPYLSESDLKNTNFDPKSCLEIENPLSFETQYLRPSLLPVILKQVAKNPWSEEIKIFEVGTVFKKEGEKKEVALISTNKIDHNSLGLKEADQNILAKFKIRKQVYLKVMGLEDFVKQANLPTFIKTQFPKVRYRPVSSFPPVVFDLAILVESNISEEKAKEIIKEASSLVFLVELFDVYKGGSLPSGKKSLAFRIILSSPGHTLDNEETKKIRQKIINELNSKIGATLRA